ncbi:alpha/beta hydrolase [Viridibacillus sp. YIM B01967]|uniref:Alpha/beta hydrolase n=1 Tax=Viridibacillus soli TaxID=2798301 RepID=A0ABS1HAM7_9BACL|nr:alpha/beta hydrolase [Viridibacillus soli]MBK3496472.1 alpha/beta hydrolase [Viridibacillus soli]
MVLQYKEYGDINLPLMVFIHGGGVSGWMWDKQVEYFSNYHCLVPDMPEHGKSSNEKLFTINLCAEKIIQLIEEKSKGKPVIAIGFSLGAQVLISILSMRPYLIDYAIINSALVRPIPFSKMLTKSLTLTYPLVKNKTFSKIQAKSMYIDENYFETYYQECCHLNKASFVRIMEENMAFKIPNNFKNSSSKILVTVGEKERSIMKKSLVDIVKSNSNCKGIILPKVGHGISLAKPDFFNKLIEDWVQNDILSDNNKEISCLYPN